jgi:hypothetical protein
VLLYPKRRRERRKEKESMCFYESPLCRVRRVSELQRGEMANTLLTGVYPVRLLPELLPVELAGTAENLASELEVAGV